MIDLLDPELHASGDALRVLRELREREPISWREGRRGRGYWAVTGHPELVAIAKDTETFSSHWGTRPEAARPDGAERPLHNLDPPEHTALRRAAGPLFDAAPIAPIIDAVVLDAVSKFQNGDALALAHAVPARIFAAWMGIGIEAAPDLDRLVQDVHRAGAALLDALDDDDARAHAKHATEALASFLRSADPPRGSVLFEIRRLGLPATLASLVVEAALPTVIDAIGNGIVLQQTDVDEILRFGSPIMQFARWAVRDAGTIRAGDQVVLWFCAANRDPRVFEDPDTFVPGRSPNPHVAFGAGPHQCIGSSLGRRILRSFFAAWKSKGPYRVESVRRPSSYMNGFRVLNVSFREARSSSSP